MNDSTTKQCTKCGESKPLSEFYLKRNHKSDPIPYSWCKQCQGKTSAKFRISQLNGTNKRIALVKSEIRVIEHLKQLGIYAASGKASEFKRVDVVAWGCIPIEVKTATLDATDRYSFAFSVNQVKRGSLSDFIVLVVTEMNQSTHFHVFPTHHPVFYANGKLKSHIVYNPKGRTELSNELMAQYKDAWYQIEDKRLEISQRLITGRLILDKTG